MLSNGKEFIILKSLAKLSLNIALVVSYSLFAYAQGFRVETKSPPAPAGSETFTSMEGRFSISLPKQISAYTPKSSDTPEGHIEGSFFSWRTAEGGFTVGYIDRPEMLESVSRKALDFLSDGALSSGNDKLKLVSKTDISIEGHPGRELKVEHPEGITILRIYLVRNRIYQVFATVFADKKEQEPAVVKILDSFKLLSQADVDAEIQRRVDEATPKPLPQEPVAKKLKSDLEDEGLKGKVKTVLTENADLSGTWAVSKRKPSSMTYFNEQGNRTKSVLYDYRGNPIDINVYGYIDGDRASNFKSIQYEYNPPPMVMPAPAGQAKPKYDSRYAYKYKYKYDDKGNLIEEQMYFNSGKLYLRYVYNYKDNHKEELVYESDGTLNQKYVFTLDDKGNEIEEHIYETKDNSVSNRYSYSYEFDSKGNWIKKTESKWTTKDRKSQYEPYSVTYRTITYY